MSYRRTNRLAPSPLRMLALLLASVMLAGVVNAFSPKGIAWTGTKAFSIEAKATEHGLMLISLERMASISQDSEWLILDARPQTQYVQGHIPGALPVPRGEMMQHLAELQALLTADQPVVVYCGGRSCDDSLAVAMAIREQGLHQVGVFEGGMAAWSVAGLPVQEGD